MPSTTPVDLYESALRPSPKRKPVQRRLTVAQPKSADDIATILMNADAYPSPVRPMGSGSSVTRCAQTAAGTIIDMSLLDRVLAHTSDSVTVQAGIRLRDLAEYLADEGMELAGGCSDANRTVGGAISSCTSGGSMPDDGAQLASTVTQITLINGLGRKVEISEKLPDLLVLTRMSYGLLGVVYSVKLKIRPIRSYTLRNSKVDFDEFSRLIPTLMGVNGAVRASLMPFRDRVYVELRYPSDEDESGSALSWKLRDWATNRALPSVVRGVGKVVPVKNLRDPLIDGFTEATHVLFGATMAGSGSNATEQTGRFKKLKVDPASVSCTWYFPAEKIPSLLTAYRRLCSGHYRKTRYRCDLPAEMWRVDMDRYALLSPSFTEAMFAMKLRASEQDDHWDDFLLEFADFASHFGGVPVFNLTKGFKPGYANDVYGERIQRFRDIRTKLDPKDRLLNQYFAEHLR